MRAKILVVDDEPDVKLLIEQAFKKKIRSQEFEFIFAQNGIEALKELRGSNDIDLVLTDINMPEMDGLTFLTKLKALNCVVKTIIISAYDDMDNIRTAMNRGAFDFVTKPINLADLETTIDKSLNELFMLKEAIKVREQFTAISRDLEIATQIQTSILPKAFPAFPDKKDIDIFAEMIPAKEVGGDFYDFFEIDENKIGLSIGDVSGKGVPAAMLMAVSRTLLKATALRGMKPADCLAIVNDVLVDETIEAMFITIFYGVFDRRDGSLEYTIAGHNPPLLINRAGEVEQVENIGGIIVAVLKGTPFESHKITMRTGDTLFLYTDGISEARNKKKNDFEISGLINSLKRLHNNTLPDLINGVIAEVNNFSGDTPQSDDITCLAFRYNGKE